MGSEMCIRGGYIYINRATKLCGVVWCGVVLCRVVGWSGVVWSVAVRWGVAAAPPHRLGVTGPRGGVGGFGWVDGADVLPPLPTAQAAWRVLVVPACMYYSF